MEANRFFEFVSLRDWATNNEAAEKQVRAPNVLRTLFTFVFVWDASTNVPKLRNVPEVVDELSLRIIVVRGERAPKDERTSLVAPLSIEKEEKKKSVKMRSNFFFSFGPRSRFLVNERKRRKGEREGLFSTAGVGVERD